MDREIVNIIKCLGLDMIDKANSGHPGIVLGAAPILYTLYAKHMHVMPSDPNWMNRDRFILSAGHGSALLYATLYMAGFLTLEDLQNFRQIHSNTPGHPEIKTPGVDMSTGPLGQGIASGVGMALAGKIYQARYTLPKKSKLSKTQSVLDYYVYVLCGDGDLMEGVTNEALSLAGSLKLNNLIILYDSNHVSLDGSTNHIFTENILDKYKAMGFNTLLVKDGNSISSIDKAIIEAKKSDKPTIIQIETVIGADSLKEGTNSVHGSPLGKEDISQIKLKLNIPNEPFYVKEELRTNFQKQIYDRSHIKYQRWEKEYTNIKGEPKVPRLEQFVYASDFNESMRTTNGNIMQDIAKQCPSFVGGAADVVSSCKTNLNQDITPENYDGNHIRFGVREHAMGAILNGLALCHFRPFGATFLAFSDYMKPAIRMSALMDLPVTYIFTHDSINIGQDGPTHQPIEQFISLRSIPNFYVYRPADANEIVGCWKTIFEKSKPSAFLISRNEVPILPTSKEQVHKGGYILRKEKQTIHGILIATGSEVNTCLTIAEELYQEKKLDLRVISMPCRELFLEQDETYQQEVIPPLKKNIVVEAGSKYGWESFVYNDKYLITIDQFGYSGKKEDVLTEMNFTKEQMKEKIINLLK